MFIWNILHYSVFIWWINNWFLQQFIENANATVCQNELLCLQHGEVLAQSKLRAAQALLMAIENSNDAVEITDEAHEIQVCILVAVHKFPVWPSFFQCCGFLFNYFRLVIFCSFNTIFVSICYVPKKPWRDWSRIIDSDLLMHFWFSGLLQTAMLWYNRTIWIPRS